MAWGTAVRSSITTPTSNTSTHTIRGILTRQPRGTARCQVPTAIAMSSNHVRAGVVMLSTKLLKNQRMPSDESRERTCHVDGTAATSHDIRKSSTWAPISRKNNLPQSFDSLSCIIHINKSIPPTESRKGELSFIWVKVINIDDAQFEGAHNEACGIDTAPTAGEEFLYEFVLSFLQTLHTERHTTKSCNLFLGVAEGQMAQEPLVVFINLIVDHGLLVQQL